MKQNGSTCLREGRGRTSRNKNEYIPKMLWIMAASMDAMGITYRIGVVVGKSEDD